MGNKNKEGKGIKKVCSINVKNCIADWRIGAEFADSLVECRTLGDRR